MNPRQFLRIKKLTAKDIIEVAARHNHREIHAEIGAVQDGKIDPARVGLNRILRGFDTATAVARHARMLMDAAGVKSLRRDAVRALEVVVSVPSQLPIDQVQFFNDAVHWADGFFAAPVISAIVHNDEGAPHCHVLILPLLNGRMIGSELMGGPSKLKAMQASFHEQVGRLHGLARKEPQKPANAAIRRQAIELAHSVLDANSGLNSELLRVLLQPHLDNPEPLLLAMGLTMPVPAVIKGGFAKMMTKPCKPEKAIGLVQRSL